MSIEKSNNLDGAEGEAGVINHVAADGGHGERRRRVG